MQKMMIRDKFTGHRIDDHAQDEKRFLPEMEQEARKRINAALEKYMMQVTMI